ncbi:SymE family type I addiction module toxin [Microbulbifer sp. 2205BS26-8]|uniref:SymE family type I addiction module toxin n=1 Tax=Microbulbifer sp. 2205BS26-8 TaxID=3064386 RepID=UPI00273F1B95|nr:SymE family type I addiction module toxin [Microbulbifer sp. 2205BS26-8]MDP5209034.1 SymE family type I addiction module toxin [Microbulbifer sp. 2205BS26-8]
MKNYEYPGHWPPRPSKQVPWLRMGDHWLAAAGFNIQAPVRVRVMPGFLVLAVDQPEQESDKN